MADDADASEHPAVHPETGAPGWQWSGPSGAGEQPNFRDLMIPRGFPFSPSSEACPPQSRGGPGCPSDRSESEAPGSPTLPELLADLSKRLPALKRCASDLSRRLEDLDDCMRQVSHKLRIAQQQQYNATSSQDPQDAQTLHSSQDD